MAEGKLVHVVVPDAIDDPLRPSGGNRYDRRTCEHLASAGWQVREHAIPDAWPRLGDTGRAALARVVQRIPDGAVVLVDALVVGARAPILVSAAARLSLVVIVHAPSAEVAVDADVLTAARAVIATSNWLRNELVRAYPLRPDAVRVAEPGVEPSGLAKGTPSGGELLCVGAVAHHKGHDVLLAALAQLGHRHWRCQCVGSLDHDPRFVTELCRQTRLTGVVAQLRFVGPKTGADLDTAFRSADVLLHPARVEGYGMVVTEALARGLPVITTTAGGLPDALGATPDGSRPGLLVPPGDAGALADAITSWLTDRGLRRRLRRAAHIRRHTLPTWSTTTERIGDVLRAAA